MVSVLFSSCVDWFSAFAPNRRRKRKRESGQVDDDDDVGGLDLGELLAATVRLIAGVLRLVKVWLLLLRKHFVAVSVIIWQ